MIINSKHTELAVLVKYLVEKECYLNVSPCEHAHTDDMYVYVYDTKKERDLDYRRFVVVSRPNEYGLIAYGDITANGGVIYDLSAKQIIDLYEKWLEEGKPEKKLSQMHGDNPTMVACRLPRLYGEETNETLYNLAYSDFEEDEDLEKSCQILKDWVYKNVPYGFVKELKKVSKELSLSELCDKLELIKADSEDFDHTSLATNEYDEVCLEDYDDEDVIHEVTLLENKKED